MSWWGKLLGGILGYLYGDLMGALVGMLLGHLFIDRRNRQGVNFGRHSREHTQAAFFAATFSVMGHISKSDGHVSQEEIRAAEHIMQQMRLSKDQRSAAIEHFNRGKQPDFKLDETLEAFRNECGRKTTLLQMFIEIQLQAVYADGVKEPSEDRVLQHICSVLGYPTVLLSQLEAMFFASKRSRQSYSSNNSYSASDTALEDAYKIIGVSESASNAEIKKAYRRLMSQNHPDKLIHKGLPEEMIEIATNKTQEIQKAYDLITETRK